MSVPIWNLGDQVVVWAVNIVLQAGIVAILASLAGLALKRSSAARYWLLCSALILVLLCPVLTAVVQTSGISLVSVSMVQEQPAAPSPETLSPIETSTTADAGPVADFTSAALPETDTFGDTGVQTVSDLAVETAATAVLPLETTARPPIIATEVTESQDAATERTTAVWGRVLRTLGPPLLIAWVVGALWLLVRLTIAWYRLSLLLRSAKRNDDERFGETFREAWLALGHRNVHRMPELVFSDSVSGPVAAGVRSPKIVLPESVAGQIDAEQLRDILIHEVAHVARGDQLVVLLQNVMGAVFWIHPLVRLLNRQLAQAREEVCDNYVLATTDATSYSRTLLTLAQLLEAPRAMPGTVGLFTSRWKLERRIAGLLDEQRNRVTRLSRAALALIGVVSVALAVTAAFGTISIAGSSARQEPTHLDGTVVSAGHVSATEETSPRSDNSEDAVSTGASEPAEQTSDNRFIYTGRVIDEENRPIAKATVAVVYSFHRVAHPTTPSVPGHNELGRISTEADGSFRIEFDDPVTRWVRADKQRPNHSPSGGGPGTVIVTFADGYAADWVSTFDADPESPLEVTLRKNSEPIQGRVVNLEGNGVAGVRASLFSLWSAERGAVDRWIQELAALREKGLLSPSPGGNSMRSRYKAEAGRFPTYSHVIADTPGIPTTVTTNDDGHFQIPHVGNDRLAVLQLEGPTIVTQRISVVSRKMEPVQGVRIGYGGPTDGTYYGSTFTHVTEPGFVAEGFVRDIDTGEPISAEVTALQRKGSHISLVAKCSWKTDENGRYRVEGLPKTDGLILEVHPGVEQPYFRQEFDLPIRDGLGPVSFDAELRRTVLFKGTLTDKRTGEPIPNAIFEYFPLLSNEHAVRYRRYQDTRMMLMPMRQRFMSDEHGAFSLVGVPGEGVIGVRITNPAYLSGFVPESMSHLVNGTRLKTHDHCSPDVYQLLHLVNVAPKQSEYQIDLQADSGELFEFEIVDPDGNPLTGYTINRHIDRNANGNRSTVYGFLKDRTRTIYLAHLGRKLGRAVTICGIPADGDVRKVRLEPMATASGRLLDEKGNPMADISLSVTREPIAGSDEYPNRELSLIERSVNTDLDGNFRIHDLMVGAQYVFKFNSTSFQSDAISPPIVVDYRTIDLGTRRLTKDRKFVAVNGSANQVVEE